MEDNTQKQYELFTPPGFTKQPLKGLNEWVSALRSGKYKQGVDFLYNKSEDSYCCLGVKLVTEGFDKELMNTRGCFFEESKSYKYLSNVGIIPCGCHVRVADNIAITLASCNDNLNLTFPEIADIIEQLWYHKN